MELRINNIDLLLPKKVPKHGKISGVKSRGRPVRVIVPTEDTKLSLIVTEPLEVLSRNVTPDGKVLGLTNYIGKTIYILDQKIEDFCEETGFVPLLDEGEELSDRTLKLFFEVCEKENLDPTDLLDEFNKLYKSKKTSSKRELNE